MAIKVDKLGSTALVNCAKTSMASKIIGADGDYFAQMAVDAVKAVKVRLEIENNVDRMKGKAFRVVVLFLEILLCKRAMLSSTPAFLRFEGFGPSFGLRFWFCATEYTSNT